MRWIDLFEDYGIDYVTEHKHVTEGWVNINCPFCGDTNYHLGVTLDGLTVNCWRCGRHNWKELVSVLTGENPYHIIGKYSGKDIPIEKTKKKKIKKLVYPKEIKPELAPIHKQYLIRRGYDLKQIKLLYGVAGGYSGKWAGRLIIPFFEDDQLVTWIGRAIGNRSPKVLNLPKSESIKSPKEMLYNRPDTEYVVLVEGAFDVWRFGYGAASISGVEITDEQKRLLLKYRHIFLALDTDEAGIMSMIDIYEFLKLLGKRTKIILLDDIDLGLPKQDVLIFNFGKKDFGELNRKEINEVKEKILEGV